MDEVDRLRQALWDVYIICGGDTDGQPTPVAIASDIIPLVLGCAQDLRDSYNEVLTNWTPPKQ